MAKERNDSYGIIDWLIKKLTPEDYENEQTLEKAIRDIATDESGKGESSINGWLDNSKDWVKDESKKSGVSFQSKLGEFEEIEEIEEPFERQVREERDIIESSETLDELRDTLNFDETLDRDRTKRALSIIATAPPEEVQEISVTQTRRVFGKDVADALSSKQTRLAREEFESLPLEEKIRRAFGDEAVADTENYDDYKRRLRI